MSGQQRETRDNALARIDTFAAFFDGLDLVDPGIVPVLEWRAEDEPQPRPPAAQVGCYGAIARVGGFASPDRAAR
jgi:hypothetical protein